MNSPFFFHNLAAKVQYFFEIHKFFTFYLRISNIFCNFARFLCNVHEYARV